MCYATVPLEVAQNFSLMNTSVNATSAVFTWYAVDTSFDRIRGFFRGYQVISCWSANKSISHPVN